MHVHSPSVRRVIGVFTVTTLLLSTAAQHAFGATAKIKTVETQTSAVATNLGLFGGNIRTIAADASYVYAAVHDTPNGFFRSSDGGATWTTLSGVDLGGVQSMWIDSVSGTLYVIFEGSGLYKSTDHGATFSLIQNIGGYSYTVLNGTQLLSLATGEVDVSTDGGVTFVPHTIATTKNISSFAASPTAGTYYAVASDSATSTSELWKSTDSAVTWTQMDTTTAGVTTDYSSVTVDPTDANHLILVQGESSATWKTFDGGTSWTQETGHTGNTTFRADGRMYAYSAYSDDHGTTWTMMDEANLGRGPVATIAFDPNDQNTMYGDSLAGVAKSTDGGLTWTNVVNGMAAVKIQNITQTTDKSTVWVTTDEGLARSTNFTSATPTWTFPITPGNGAGVGEGIWVKPDDANIVVVGNMGGIIWRSTDGGTTWAEASAPSMSDSKYLVSSRSILDPYNFASDPNNSSIVYAAVAAHLASGSKIGDVLKSTDAGATWTSLAITNDVPARTVTVAPNGDLFAGIGVSYATTGGIYRYRDGAWAQMTGIGDGEFVYHITVDPEDNTRMYAVTSIDYNSGKGGFYKSTDSGSTWTKKTSGLSTYSNFTTLTLQRSTSPNTLYASALDKVGGQGVLLKSSDAGETWGLLYQGLKSETFNSVLFDALVAGNSRGVFGMKSKVRFNQSQTAKKVQNNIPVVISATLKDSATKKLLKSKNVELDKLVGKKWKKVRISATNKKAVVKFTVKSTKTTKYRLVYTPNKSDKSEYAATTSGTITVTIKK